MPDPTFHPTPAQTDSILHLIAAEDRTLSDIAADHGVTPESVALWIASPAIAERLESLHSAFAARIRLSAANLLPAALTSLASIIRQFNDEVAHTPVDPRSLPAIEQRRRAGETARRAAALIIRLSRYDTPPPPRRRPESPPARRGPNQRSETDSAFEPAHSIAAPAEPVEAKCRNASCPSWAAPTPSHAGRLDPALQRGAVEPQRAPLGPADAAPYPCHPPRSSESLAPVPVPTRSPDPQRSLAPFSSPPRAGRADNLGKNRMCCRTATGPAMLLHELIEGLDIELGDAGGRDTRICDITEDSRTVLPGSLFIARAGTRDDGRRFIADAARAGAAAVLLQRDDRPPAEPAAWPRGVVRLHAADIARATALLAERFYGAAADRLAIFGVTGTNGKTTVSYLIYQLLRRAGIDTGLIGTVFIDDGRGLTEAAMTTPPALEISHCLSRMRENGFSAVALEVSSHSLDQQRVAALRFKVGIFTNLSGDHLDYHGTMDRYASAKARLFDQLTSDGVAVINADDPASRIMIERHGGRTLRCTASPDTPAECSVRLGRAAVAGFEASFRGPWGVIECTVPLIGEHNAMNTLQALAAAHAAGAPADALAAALPKLNPPPGRLEPVTREWGRGAPARHDPALPFSVFVDYAHSDDSLAKAIAALRPLLPGAGAKLRVVFGCGGDRDRTKRPRMGRAAADDADTVIVTSDNPRTEDPGAIIREILAGIEPAAMGRVHVEPDRRLAIEQAIDQASEGDIILIAGKGHENYQLVPDGRGGIRRLSFDDRLAARDALSRRAARESGATAPAATPAGRRMR